MKAELIIPLACLRGKLRNDGYYFRLYRDLRRFEEVIPPRDTVIPPSRIVHFGGMIAAITYRIRFCSRR